MNKLSFTCALTSILIVGCASTQSTQVPSQQVSFPSLGQATEVTLGESMLTQATGHIANSITVGDVDGSTTRINAGKFCQLNSKSDFYTSFGGVAYIKNAAGEATAPQKGVSYSNGKVCIPGTMGFGCYTSDEVSIEFKSNDLCIANNSFQQVIEYNGKSDNNLKFTYREFSSNMARAPYTTDFTMDLRDGNQVGYKGAKLEILKATNTSVSYKVISNFKK